MNLDWAYFPGGMNRINKWAMMMTTMPAKNMKDSTKQFCKVKMKEKYFVMFYDRMKKSGEKKTKLSFCVRLGY